MSKPVLHQGPKKIAGAKEEKVGNETVWEKRGNEKVPHIQENLEIKMHTQSHKPAQKILENT
jgi:hypothetical protein